MELLDEGSQRKFEKFVQSSAGMPAGPPRCLRIALKDAGSQIPADVFHVRLPQLYGNSVRHLLALKVDADSHPHPEAGEDAIPSSLLSKAPTPRKLSEASSQSDSVQFYDEPYLSFERGTDKHSPRAHTSLVLRITWQASNHQGPFYGPPYLSDFVRTH